MSKNPDIVLSFDLDYTIIDNTEGIVNSFQFALQELNLPLLSDSKIKKMIGIPLDDMFREVSNSNIDLLVKSFRNYYSKKGIYEVEFLPGVKEKLKELSEKYSMGIVTSKKQEMAIKLLNYLQITKYFNFILGENKEIKTKIDPTIINFFLENFPRKKYVIIGDHPSDKALAEKLNCPFIGVLTGNTRREDLLKELSIPVLICNSVKDLTIDKIAELTN